MKKIGFLLFLLGLFSFVGTTTFADDCKQVEFDNGDGRVCININKDDDDTFELETDVEKGNGTLRCGILLSNNTYKEVLGCNGDFTVSNQKEQLIKIYVKFGSEYPTDWDGKPNNKSERIFPQWMYDFDEGEWTDGISNNDNNNSNGDLDEFEIKLDDNTPEQDDELELTINAVDSDGDDLSDYDGSNAEITIEYRTSSSSSWRDAGSSQVDIDDETPSFSNGEASTNITFKYEYDYRITVTDEDEDIESSKIFYIGEDNSDSNGDLYEFEIELDDNTPEQDDELELTINAVDSDGDDLSDYDGSNAEITVEYRTSSSSSWSDAGSSQVDIDDETPSFSNGEASTNITFKYEYDYKITVTDDDEDIDTARIFYIGEDNSDNNGDLDEFEIELDDNTPEQDDELELTINAVDSDGDDLSDYDGSNAEITLEYRTSSSSSWRDAGSSYYEIDDETPSFSNGEASTNITFKYNYDYRITVTDDTEGVDSSKIFYIGEDNTNNNGDLDEFEIALDDNTPEQDDELELTINAVDSDGDDLSDYDGSNAEITVEYRSSSSSSWRDATSSYYSIDDKTPNFSNGEASTNITFKYDYDYKITVTDDDEDVDSYKIFYVGGSNNNTDEIDNFLITSEDTSPDTNERIDISIKARDSGNSTITDYTDTVEFVIYYRTSSSSSWKETSSSTYFEIDNDYDDGYDFVSSDKGYVTLKNIIRFKKEYDFKIRVVDENDEDVYGEKIFYVGDTTSGIDGYTSSEMKTIEKLYNAWDALIKSFKASYSKLRYNQTWIDMSDDLKDEMKKIIDDSSSKKYDNYDEFSEAIQDRYSYILRNK